MSSGFIIDIYLLSLFARPVYMKEDRQKNWRKKMRYWNILVRLKPTPVTQI